MSVAPQACLIGRQGAGKSRVEDGETGNECLSGTGAFEQALLFGDDAAVARFTARRRDGEHHADRQRFFHRNEPFEKVPHVPVGTRAERDCFGGVDDAAASDRQNGVEPVFTAETDPFPHQAEARIGLDAGEFGHLDAGVRQTGQDRIIQAAAFDGAAAIYQQHPPAKRGHPFPDLFLHPLSEKDAGRIIKFKVEHDKSPLCYPMT